MYEQFFIIFALVIMGFFLGRRGIMDENTDAGFNKMIMKFIVPCMFIYKIGSLEMTGETMRECGRVLYGASEQCFYGISRCKHIFRRVRTSDDGGDKRRNEHLYVFIRSYTHGQKRRRRRQKQRRGR